MAPKFIAATILAVAIGIWVIAYGYFSGDETRAMLIVFTIIGAGVIGRARQGGAP